jgi:hypothetical protein
MTTLDEVSLETVTGGGAGSVLKLGGKWFGPVDVLTSGWDAYSGYRDARAANKSVKESLGAGAVNFVRSITVYDVWSKYCGEAY